MFPADRIRFHLIAARKRPEGAARDVETVRLLADAMIEERRQSGAATEQALIDRHGFTADELARHRTAATDLATSRFVGAGELDPGIAA